MIFGDCPYDDCGAGLMLGIADPAGRYQKHECDECGRTIWTYHSRMVPHSMTDEDFRAEWEIDEETKTLQRRS